MPHAQGHVGLRWLERCPGKVAYVRLPGPGASQEAAGMVSYAASGRTSDNRCRGVARGSSIGVPVRALAGAIFFTAALSARLWPKRRGNR